MIRTTSSVFLLACFLSAAGATILPFPVKNGRDETTTCRYRLLTTPPRSELLCRNQIEAFKVGEQPYVFAEQTLRPLFMYTYRQLHYDTPITDEKGTTGNCSLVVPNALMYCATPLSNFEYQDQEWGFETKGNGFLEYIAWTE